MLRGYLVSRLNLLAANWVLVVPLKSLLSFVCPSTASSLGDIAAMILQYKLDSLPMDGS